MAGTLTGLSVISPDGHTLGQRDAPYPPEAATRFEYRYADPASLDRFLPAGSHEFTFDTFHDGRLSAALDLGNGHDPPAPVLLDATAAAAIDPAADFDLEWNGMTDPGPHDAVVVRIVNAFRKKILETPELGEAGALAGTTRGLTIPAGVLVPGRPHRLEIQFVRVVDVETNAYPGVTGLAYRSRLRPASHDWSRRPFAARAAKADKRPYDSLGSR